MNGNIQNIWGTQCKDQAHGKAGKQRLICFTSRIPGFLDYYLVQAALIPRLTTAKLL